MTMGAGDGTIACPGVSDPCMGIRAVPMNRAPRTSVPARVDRWIYACCLICGDPRTIEVHSGCPIGYSAL